jgi:general nucleoside transport system permease protein
VSIRLIEEDRRDLPTHVRAFILFASLAAGLAAMALIFAASGKNPAVGLWRIFRSGFLTTYGIGETFSRALPLALTGVGLCVAFQGRFWNIGAEGQILAGACMATWVGLGLGNTELNGAAVIALMAIAGAAGGAAWGLIAALLRNYTEMNETISTLMLNYVLAEFVRFLIVGPWKGKSQHGFPYTDNLPDKVMLATVPGTRIPYLTALLAVIAVVLIYAALRRTKFGYEIRVLGENREAARYAGIDAKKLTLFMMLISGGLAGLAGFSEIAANHRHMTYPDTISAGYGFTAIIVAQLASLDPRWVIFSSIFFAGIIVGGDSIQIAMGLPAATVQVFQGVILVFLIMSEFFMRSRLRFVVRKTEEEATRG